MKWMRALSFEDCLDAGCAQPYLIENVLRSGTAKVFGCDISLEVIEQNRRRFPQAQFEQFDLAAQAWPGGRQFDLVVCSEAAVANLARMCRKHLLVTVPGGKVHPIDKHIGHIRHFDGKELAAAIERAGLRIRKVKRWGFPFHSLYKHAINKVAPQAVYAAFTDRKYGWGKRLVSGVLNVLFYANDLFRSGCQVLVLAERTGAGDGTLASGSHPQ
jgi:hypothetical protein